MLRRLVSRLPSPDSRRRSYPLPLPTKESRMFQSVSGAPSSASDSVDALVVGCYKPSGGRKAARPALDDATAKRLDEATRAAVESALQRVEATGDAGQILEAFPSHANGAKRKGPSASRVFALGLGEAVKLDAETMRAAAAALGRRLAGAKCERAHLELAAALSDERVALRLDRAGQCVGESVGLLSFVFDHFKGTVNGEKSRKPLALSSPAAAFSKGMERGRGLALSTNFSRFLSNTPPNVATPAWIADQAKDLAAHHRNLKVKVFEGATLEKE